MDLQAIVNAAPPKPPQPSQGSRSSLGETWVSCKNEIYKVYMAEKNTLPKTMELFEREYGLKACTRTWKTKLKEWKFEKYLTDKENNIIAAEAKKRRREGEETTGFDHSLQTIPGRLANYKRRNVEDGAEVVSLSAATPEDLTYYPSLEIADASTNSNIDERDSVQQQALDRAPPISTLGPINPVIPIGMQIGSHNIESGGNLLISQMGASEIALITTESKKDNEDVGARQLASLATYSASLVMLQTVENDIRLFEIAKTAKLVRIKYRNPGEDLEIYMWCDGCQRIFGARLTYACVLCSTGRGIMTYCSACYNDKKGFCLNYNHPLSPDTSFLQSKCRMAYFPEYLRYCDALNCGKRISGLYFHCCICDNDNFDICLQCVMGGNGCNSVDHVLSIGVRPIDRGGVPP